MWSPEKFIELIVPGIVVGLIMLVAQFVLEPVRERKTLIERERWQSKKNAFEAAVQLIDRYFSTLQWNGPTMPKSYIPAEDKPAGREINAVIAQLLLLSDDVAIPEGFAKFFAKGSISNPATRGEFIIMLRKELFNTQSSLTPLGSPFQLPSWKN